MSHVLHIFPPLLVSQSSSRKLKQCWSYKLYVKCVIKHVSLKTSAFFFRFQPITVYNEAMLPQRLVCQVCDADGNPCHQDNVRVQIAKDKALTVSKYYLKVKVKYYGKMQGRDVFKEKSAKGL